MANHMMDKHPLDALPRFLTLVDEIDFDAILEDEDERRYVAEHKAVRIDESSSVEQCAYTVSKLMAVHIPQLNKRFKDQAKSRHYSNPVELIREEKKIRDNKKIWYTGNVAAAHEHIKTLEDKIVSEETPAQMLKWIFWCLLFGLGFLALAIYSSVTGAGVDFVVSVIDSTWFYVLFAVTVLALSLYFGFFSMGILIVGGVFLLAWILFELPGLASVIVNGVLYIVAAILLFVVIFYVYSLITYKPLSEEDHEQNQARIAEKKAWCQELEEYSDTMLAKLSIMRSKFSDHNDAFMAEMRKHINGNYDTGAVYEIFSFLEKYYRKMRRFG